MRLVAEPDELEDAYAAAAAEAEAAFGDGSFYVERAVVPTRHVEIQVLCDADGGVLTLGERECSIQRRHQKLIEESPSCALDALRRESRWRRRSNGPAAGSGTSTQARSSSSSDRTASRTSSR